MERRRISSQTLWNLLTQALKNKFGFTLRLFERTPCFRESKTEESSLHVVVVYGEAGKISELIINERKVRTQTEVSKEMALHWVSNLGKPEYCCQLATYGGSLTAEDGSEEGNSTIHFAIIHGQEEFARWQVGVCASAANKKGISPTFYATCYLHTQLVQSLVVKGASVDYQVSSHNNATPLHLAVRSGNEAMVKMLLKCGVDPHIFCSYNRTPLHWAASYGNLQILKSMETCGAELSTRTNDECGHQPIHLAAGNGHTAVVEWLLDNGVAVESPSNLGFTPLYVAAVNGQNKLVLRLLRRGAQVENFNFIITGNFKSFCRSLQYPAILIKFRLLPVLIL
jgi:ankyrin repeat protein